MIPVSLYMQSSFCKGDQYSIKNPTQPFSPLNREVCGIGSYHAIILFQSKVVGICTLINKISSGLLCEDSYENAMFAV